MTPEALEAELAHPLGSGRLAVSFQPIVRLADGAAAGVEALGRWIGADGREIRGEALFAAAEALGLRGPLARLLTERAIGAFAARPHGAGSVSLNASCAELADGGFAPALLARLHAAGLAPGRVWVEVTEQAPLLDAPGVAHSLSTLRAAGVRVAIDDFGALYANLAWLMRLPLDGVKLDACFTAAIEADASARAIVRHMAALAEELGLRVVAEGVESQGQAHVLAELGCTYGQGRLFGMPAAG